MSMPPIRQALDFGERPDPRAGLCETLLVEAGTPAMLTEHYARMSASARELYGVEPSLSAAEPLSKHSWNGWCRITFIPSQGTRSETGPTRPDPAYAGLAPFVLPGGLGPHKWADRGLVDALNEIAGEALPLLIDTDGSVLETTWANVLIEEAGRLISPPDDGRALPGLGRLQLRYIEQPIDLDRLLGADALVLTSSLRTVRVDLAT